MRDSAVSASQPSELFFGRPPVLNDLCGIIVSVPANTSNSYGCGAIQPKVLKCRELIFTEPDIIAAPVLLKENEIQIIMQASPPRRVTLSDFQACVTYTLLAKLAPSWNKVADYLIQGRNFIVDLDKMNTITFDLVVSEDEMYLSLQANIIRLPPLRLSDLTIAPPVMREFLAPMSTARIDGHSLENNWCHILPSMKRGQIVGITHTIPDGGPFKLYKDMKKYWKNMDENMLWLQYGYRLPDSDEGMLYAQVHFRPIGGKLFTYPLSCIRQRQATVFQRPDTRPILAAFLSDLTTKMPRVCGAPFAFHKRPMYPVTTLQESNAAENGSKANLSQDAPFARAPLVKYRPSFSSSTNQITAHTVPQPDLPINHRLFGTTVQAKVSSNMSATNANTSQGLTNSFNQRIKPTFVPKTHLKNRSLTIETPAQEPKLPRYAPALVVKKCLTQFGTEKLRIGDTAPQMAIPDMQESSLHQTAKQAISFASKAHAALPKLYNQSANQAKIFQGSNKTPCKASFISNNPKTNIHTSTLKPSAENTTTEDHVLNTPRKRKLEDNRDDGRKAKIKKLLEGLDIEHLAKNNQLEKVNTATLIHWLKEKGVPCKSREKKADLIAKAISLVTMG